MKIFSFIISIIVFGVTLFYLITDFPSLHNINGFIYLFLMLILLLICITGILVNMPLVKKIRRRRKSYMPIN